MILKIKEDDKQQTMELIVEENTKSNYPKKKNYQMKNEALSG